MLEKLEMHDIQDKTRLLDEMNETRQGVNDNRKAFNALEARVKSLAGRTPIPGKSVKSKSKGSKPKTGPVKGNPQRFVPKPGALGPKPD